MRQAGGGDGGDHLGRVPVGEVALAPCDALLEHPGPAGLGKERFVVVCLDYERLALPEMLPYQVGGGAYVGGDPELGRAAGNDETDRLVGVVRNREGMQDQVSDREGLVG